MKYKLCAVRYNKAVLFWQPQAQTNEETAKRDFAMMVRSSDLRSQVGFAPEDFDLYLLGEFDTVSGEIVSLKVPEFICNGASFKEVRHEE